MFQKKGTTDKITGEMMTMWGMTTHNREKVTRGDGQQPTTTPDKDDERQERMNNNPQQCQTKWTRGGKQHPTTTSEDRWSQDREEGLSSWQGQGEIGEWEFLRGFLQGP